MNQRDVFTELEQRKTNISRRADQIKTLSAAQDRLRTERVRPPNLTDHPEDWNRVRLVVRPARYDTDGASVAQGALLAVVTEHAPGLFRLAELSLQAQERALRVQQRLFQQQFDAALAAAGEALLSEEPTTTKEPQ